MAEAALQERKSTVESTASNSNRINIWLKLAERYPDRADHYWGLVVGPCLDENEAAALEMLRARKYTQDPGQAERKRAEARSQRLLDDSGLSGDMLNHTFDAFEFRHQSQATTAKGVQWIVDHFYRDAKGVVKQRGWCLYGETGVGKTHCSQAGIIYACEKGLRAKFIDCLLLGECEDLKNLKKWALDTDILVLDEMGKALVGGLPERVKLFVIEIIQHVAEQRTLMLCATCQAPLKSARDENGKLLLNENKEPILLGYDDELEDYQVGRLELLCYWREVEGPNGRDPKYWEDDIPHWVR
jgi:DNA replication protein DnaC